MKYAGVILFLVGIVTGIMVSPKGERMIGVFLTSRVYVFSLHDNLKVVF